MRPTQENKEVFVMDRSLLKGNTQQDYYILLYTTVFETHLRPVTIVCIALRPRQCVYLCLPRLSACIQSRATHAGSVILQHKVIKRPYAPYFSAAVQDLIGLVIVILLALPRLVAILVGSACDYSRFKKRTYSREYSNCLMS